MNCSTCEIGWRRQHTKEIKKRVKEHDNREYEIVQDICAYYDCDEARIFHPKLNYSYATRTLYIYCMVYLLGRRQVDVAHLLHMQKANLSRDLKAIINKFKDKKEREKFEFLLKY